MLLIMNFTNFRAISFWIILDYMNIFTRLNEKNMIPVQFYR